MSLLIYLFYTRMTVPRSKAITQGSARINIRDEVLHNLCCTEMLIWLTLPAWIYPSHSLPCSEGYTTGPYP